MERPITGVLQVPLQYVYESVQSVLPRMEALPAHPLNSHPPTHIAICVRARTMCSASQRMFTRASHEAHTFRHILQYVYERAQCVPLLRVCLPAHRMKFTRSDTYCRGTCKTPVMGLSILF